MFARGADGEHAKPADARGRPRRARLLGPGRPRSATATSPWLREERRSPGTSRPRTSSGCPTRGAGTTGRSCATRTCARSRAIRRRSARGRARSSATRRPSSSRPRCRSSRWTRRGTRSCAGSSPPRSRRGRSRGSRTASALNAKRIVEEAAPTGGGDFVELIAKRLPLVTISDMIGVPEADRERVVEAADLLVTTSDPEAFGERPPIEVLGEALWTLTAFAKELAAHREREPGEDLMTGARPGRGRRRAPHPRRDRGVLRAAVGRGQRHDPPHHLARDARADASTPISAALLLEDLDGRLPSGGRGVRALGLAGADLPAHDHAAGRAARPRAARGREGRALLPLGQPRRARLRGPVALRHHARSQPPPRASAAAARTTAWARRWRAHSCARSSAS